MNPLFIFTIVLIFGYIATSLFVNNFLSKFYKPPGIEYIILGIILGPSFANWLQNTFLINYPYVITNDLLFQLKPGISAAIGFIGLTYGLKFNFANILKYKREHFNLAVFDIFICLLVIGGSSFALFYYFFFNGNNLNNIIAASLALSFMGSISSPYLIKGITEKNKSEGSISTTLLKSSVLSVNINILLFGIIFGAFHKGTNPEINLTPTEWVVISIFLAVIIGILFFLFLGREADENKYFVAIIGIAVFTSGIAYFINLSPLYMNFILGVILSNFSPVREKLELSLDKYLHPFEILIIIMAGFYWIPSEFITFIIAIPLFFLLRYFAKNLAGILSYQTSYLKEKLVPQIGKGILSHGIVASVMVIDYMNVYKNEFTSIVVSCILSSILFFEIISLRSTKNLLIDVGEISREKA